MKPRAARWQAAYAACEAAAVRAHRPREHRVGPPGQAPAPETDEDSPLSLWQEFAYNNAKVRAERALRRARAKGRVEMVMLRPGIVLGPRSRWITELADALLASRAALVDHGRGVCNSVYVDNLVHAVELAGRAPGVDGEAFLVGDAERVTWADLYGPVASALGYDLSSVPCVEPPRQVARWSDRLRDAARHSERFAPVRRAMAPATAALRGLRRRPVDVGTSPSPGTVAGPFLDGMNTRLQQCAVKLPFDKARRMLGYEPPLSFDEGMRRTIAWMKAVGYPVRPAAASPSPAGDSA